jgi:hypothetical protein
MLITALPVFDVSVLIGGQDFRQYEVPADHELQEIIIEAEHDLWQRVLKGEPPQPNWEHPSTGAALRKLYPGTNGKSDRSLVAAGRVPPRDGRGERPRATCQKTADGLKSMLLWDMKEAANLRFADGKCLRRKEVTRKGYVVEETRYVDARIANYKELTA